MRLYVTSASLEILSLLLLSLEDDSTSFASDVLPLAMEKDGIEQPVEELEVGCVYNVEICATGVTGFFIGALLRMQWSEDETVTLLKFDWGELTEFEACNFYNLSEG